MNSDAPPFTLRKPDERSLLEIWHIGYELNISYGICVIDPSLYWSNPADQQPLVVRCGYPPGCPLAPPGPMGEEGSITRAEFHELLEPLKHIQVPPCPGEEALLCDGGKHA